MVPMSLLSRSTSLCRFMFSTLHLVGTSGFGVILLGWFCINILTWPSAIPDLIRRQLTITPCFATARSGATTPPRALGRVRSFLEAPRPSASKVFFSSFIKSCVGFDLDECAITSVATETAGLLWALIYSLQIPWQHPVEIICDCLPALTTTASGLSQRDPLADLTAHVFSEISRVRSVKLTHTGGHEGSPWNELCDVIAKSARVQPPPDLPHDITEHLYNPEGRP